jgi:hypothetical protein
VVVSGIVDGEGVTGETSAVRRSSCSRADAAHCRLDAARGAGSAAAALRALLSHRAATERPGRCLFAAGGERGALEWLMD